MYAAIYSYEIENGRRKHLGNVNDIEFKTALRTFDFNTTEVNGKCDFNISKPLIYTINDERGRQLFAGFYKKSNRTNDSSKLLSFSGEDFKKILDTDVLLDYSSDIAPDLSLKGIFTKVANQITSSKDPFITTIDLEFIIPNDLSNTKAIADYTGQYIVVNAIQFLKVYLAFYGYYIKPTYDALLDKITFEFKKMSSEIISIKLKDFTHEKTSADIKVNKTIATLSYKTVMEDVTWLDSNLAYFDSQPYANRSTIVGSVLPTPDGYPAGFAVRLVSDFEWQSATESEYDLSDAKSEILIQKFMDTVCMIAPTVEQTITAAGDPNNAQYGTVVKAMFKLKVTGEICQLYPTYIKLVPITQAYHQRSGMNYQPRPNLPEKVYTLGNDNQIYDGYAPFDKRIYPIVAKVFESEYLSAAQLNAVYEIVNNRYVENIIITQENMVTTLNLSVLDLYTPIRVYDSDGSYKDIPISEKTYTHKANQSKVEIKLGFKKTLMTEIIKNEIGTPDIVKTAGGGSGSTTIVESQIPWVEETEPNPNDYKTWFKPVSGDIEMMSMMLPSSDGELTVQEDTSSEELQVEGASNLETTY